MNLITTKVIAITICITSFAVAQQLTTPDLPFFKTNQREDIGTTAFEAKMPGLLIQAKAGDGYSAYLVGEQYWRLRLTPSDDVKAVKYLNIAKEAGIVEADASLKLLNQLGRGTSACKIDLLKLKKQADEGKAGALFDLANLYLAGEIVEYNNNKAYELFYKAALQGYTHAMYRLGILYAEDDLFYRDYIKACYWFNQAAMREHAQAMTALADLLKDGKGSVKDCQQAELLYLKAVKSGNPAGYMGLGILYSEAGYGMVNFNKAKAMFDKATQYGSSNGELYIGKMYLYGMGTAIDVDAALTHFKNAANNGNTAACVFAGKLLLDGKADDTSSQELPQSRLNESDAYTLLARANAQGSVWGKYFLAKCYAQGKGTKADVKYAKVLMNEAKQAGATLSKADEILAETE